MTSAIPRRKLLILDDRADVLRSLARYFGAYFDEVHTAQSPEAAERILADSEPEALLCDYWLGHGMPTGTELVARWRARFGCLRRVALMTGTKDSALSGTESVDRVFEKPIDLEAARSFLLAAL